MIADVSVIIAAYNIASYVGRAVDSALGQPGVAVEVIVVDDCSTDGTATALAGITDSRVRAIRLPSNQGAGAARNVAIPLANAPWIAILDGDDLMLPERLAHMLAVAKNQSADIVVDNLLRRREDNGKEEVMFDRRRLPDPLLELPQFLGDSAMLGGASLGFLKPLFSTTFLRQHRLAYDSGLRHGEDYQIMAEALALGARCAVTLRAGYVYTLRKGSTSSHFSVADAAALEQANARLVSRYQFNPATRCLLDRRQRSLRTIKNYVCLAESIKQRNLPGVAAALWRHPQVTRHLWRPLWRRLTS